MTALSDISIYTETEEEIKLRDILTRMKEHLKEGPAPNPVTRERICRLFFQTVVPEYDRERFYASHMKKYSTGTTCCKRPAPSIFWRKKKKKHKRSEQSRCLYLGCSKNRVDSEHLMRQLEHGGWMVVPDAVEEDYPWTYLLSTRADLSTMPAKNPSIFLLEALQAKEEGRLGKVLVMGCLSGRYREELEDTLPQADGFTVSTTYRLYAHSWAWPMTQSWPTNASFPRRPIMRT